ncbi:BglII/BstYI family type II restriction endonuclease [Blastococcus mobilis]|uniref:Restriction endonuclease BglII n=1 Tax=Blastococcus mobilis TaxID=1938746 RepID=A0A238VXH9_9ACTN|nr:BglII/BstYI family type II restriction endonuclease [Blastococcus mobilis]SNR39022.1 Restriction endonuclease BglII [Blastococcus mobilis]
MPDEPLTDDTSADPIIDAQAVITGPTVTDLPDGYSYGVTRYADLILRDALPDAWDALVKTLTDFHIELQELQTGGGGRTRHVTRFDATLNTHGWAKKNIRIAKTIDGQQVYEVRGHEIDMFTLGPDGTYPGAAVEMEWNNKDPFFDRDLINYQALHREGVLAAGVIVTRGDRLQALLKDAILGKDGSRIVSKYGESTTHWRKLLPRVALGGGGECPLLLIGIEPERINDLRRLEEVAEFVRDAREFLDQKQYQAVGMTRAEAQQRLRNVQEAAIQAIPPLPRERD